MATVSERSRELVRKLDALSSRKQQESLIEQALLAERRLAMEEAAKIVMLAIQQWPTNDGLISQHVIVNKLPDLLLDEAGMEAEKQDVPISYEGWRLAEKFHKIYERLAPTFGYETRAESAKPWTDIPSRNRELMAATCTEILAIRAAVEKEVGK